MAYRQRLPNLKICVDNTETSDESDAEVDHSISSHDENISKVEMVAEDALGTDANILSVITSSPTERRFLTREAVRNENELREEKRRHRFGTLSNPKQPITDVDIKNLYKSLGINMDKISEDPHNWKLEAVQMKGVENMSTQEILGYFSEYEPKDVEWLDDSSCNVLFANKLKAAKALIHLSSSFTEVQIAESIVDEQMEAAARSGPSPSNSPKIKVETSENINTSVKEKPTTTVADDGKASSDPAPRPAMLDTTGDAMELDFDDDNFDLIEDDPLNRTVDNSKPVSGQKKTQVTSNDTTIPSKGKTSNASENDKNKNESKAGKSKNSKEGLADRKGSKGKGNSDAKMDVKPGGKGKDKVASKKKSQSKSTKESSMDVDKESGGDDSDSSSSSSSSSSGSSSSSSSSSSGSDSDSSSSSSSASNSSTSSSSSSSSSSTAAGHNKDEGRERKKKRKTRSQRDQEAVGRGHNKTVRAAKSKNDGSDIPWPSGWWRLGKPHVKADYIFMRYAEKDDITNPTTEKETEPSIGILEGSDRLSSHSRKRRSDGSSVSTISRHVVEDKPARKMAKAFSRLTGRLGTRQDKESGGRNSSNASGKHQDLRQRLQLQKDEELPFKDKVGESDDEMDYSAELEKLMGPDEPVSKKRFMRMRADDEEEEIERSKKYAQTVEATCHTYPELDEDEEEGFFEGEDYADSETEEKPHHKRREYVDLDNVDDDDPFNLFGSTKPEPVSFGELSNTKFDDMEDEKEHVRLSRDFRDDRRKPLDHRNDEGRSGGVGDLRDKLKKRRMRENRGW